MTPLHRAVFAHKHDTIPFLLECRSDPWCCNGKGETCFDMAGAQYSLQNLLKGVNSHSTDRSGMPHREDTLPADELPHENNEGNIVESLLRNSSADWLLPYYHTV